MKVESVLYILLSFYDEITYPFGYFKVFVIAWMAKGYDYINTFLSDFFNNFSYAKYFVFKYNISSIWQVFGIGSYISYDCDFLSADCFDNIRLDFSFEAWLFSDINITG